MEQASKSPTDLDSADLERRDGERVVDHLERVRAFIEQRQMVLDSTNVIRLGRIERTNDLMRAAGQDDLIDPLAELAIYEDAVTDAERRTTAEPDPPPAVPEQGMPDGGTEEEDVLANST